MDILKLTYSDTQIHHRVNSMHCPRNKQKEEEITTLFFQMKKNKGCVCAPGLAAAICVLFFIRGTPEPVVALFVRLAHRIDRLVGATALPDQ